LAAYSPPSCTNIAKESLCRHTFLSVIISLTHDLRVYILCARIPFPHGKNYQGYIAMPHHQQDPDNLSSLLDELDGQTDLREPKMYRVILHNDHYTTMDFVVKVLIEIFHKPLAEATRIMMHVHKRGRGICGVYTYNIALTKVREVESMARQSEFPLKCTLEEE